MRVDVHWQDADSSSSNAVSEVFPDAKIMICGGHSHKKQLEVRAKQKSFTNAFIARYEKQYPQDRMLTCHCRGNHKAGCGCLSVGFIGKAHTDFSSILMECQSQELDVLVLCLIMHVMYTSGMGESVISTHSGCALMKSVTTKTR